ncbi:MAG: hypothetical protein AAF628_25945 [Planctomycetota bacterium]
MAIPAWALSLPIAIATLAACSGDRVHDDRFAQQLEIPAGIETVRVEVSEGSITFENGAPGVVAIEAMTRCVAPSGAALDRLKALDLRLQAEVAAPGVWVLRGAFPEDQAPAAADDNPRQRGRERLITRCMIRVPPELAVECRTRLGPVSAMARQGRVRLETGTGPVRLDQCRGDAVLRIGRGAVLVDGHAGSLDIELATWQGAPVREREGDTLQVFMTALGPDGVRIVAPHANVQCHLPDETGFEMQVTSGAGRGRNGFGVPVTPLEGKKFGMAMRGIVGAGGPPLQIAVDHGNVSVRRRLTPDGPAKDPASPEREG